jgi:hypothetical protein
VKAGLDHGLSRTPETPDLRLDILITTCSQRLVFYWIRTTNYLPRHNRLNLAMTRDAFELVILGVARQSNV